VNHYRVYAKQTISTSYLVMANSEEEAEEKAWMAVDDGIEPTTSYCEDGDFEVINVRRLGREFSIQASFYIKGIEA